MSLVNIDIATNALGLEKPAHALVKAIVKGIGATLYPWQKGRSTRADLEAFAAWQRELANLKSGSAELDLNLSDRTEIRLRLEGERFQANREAIAKEGVKSFKSLPESERAGDPDEIEDEWLDQFWRYAETISSEDLQSVWGKVLARQASGKSNISARTLSFLSTLSRQEASWIEAVAKVTIGGLQDHRRVFSLVNSMNYFGSSGSFEPRNGSEYAMSAEQHLASLSHTAQWSDLDSIGVLAQTGWAYETLLPISDKGAHLTIAGKSYIVKSGTESVAGHLSEGKLRFGSGLRFSNLGTEVLSIVDVEPDERFLFFVTKIVSGFGMKLEAS